MKRFLEPASRVSLNLGSLDKQAKFITVALFKDRSNNVKVEIFSLLKIKAETIHGFIISSKENVISINNTHMHARACAHTQPM